MKKLDILLSDELVAQLESMAKNSNVPFVDKVNEILQNGLALEYNTSLRKEILKFRGEQY